MLNKFDLEIIDQYWAKDLNCTVQELSNEKNKLQLVETNRNEIYFFQKNESCIVESPKKYFDKINDLFKNNNLGNLSEESFRLNFQNKIEKLIGPAYIGYVDSNLFKEMKSATTFLLKPEQTTLLRKFRTEISDLEWEHSGIEFNHYPIFVFIEDKKITAAASFEVWNEKIAHIGVVTNKEYRNKGYGKQVVSAITKYCLDNNLIPQYRTLKSNVTSISIANFLGFQEYASTTFIKFFKI